MLAPPLTAFRHMDESIPLDPADNIPGWKPPEWSDADPNFPPRANKWEGARAVWEKQGCRLYLRGGCKHQKTC